MEISAKKMSRQLWGIWRVVATLDSKAAAGHDTRQRPAGLDSKAQAERWGAGRAERWRVGQGAGRW